MFAIYPVDHYIYQKHVDKLVQSQNKRITKTEKVNKINNIVKNQQYRERNRLEIEKGTIIDVKV